MQNAWKPEVGPGALTDCSLALVMTGAWLQNITFEFLPSQPAVTWALRHLAGSE